MPAIDKKSLAACKSLMAAASREGGDKKNIYALGFVSFFTDLSSEMIFGLLPLFLTAQLGASRAALGLVEGVAEMLGYTVRMGSGAMSDRMQRRKPLVVLGYSLSAAAKPLFAFAGGWADAFAVRSADRVGKGIRTAPRDALISESAPESRMARSFGIHRSMDQAGAIAGPALAFLLFPYVGFEGIFYASLLPGAVAVVILFVFVKERLAPPPGQQQDRQRPSVPRNIRSLLSEKRFVALLAIMGVFSLGAFNFSFVLVRASDLGVGDGAVVLVYLVINAAHALVGYPAGVLADRVGREKMLAVAYGLFLVSAVFMAASTEAAHAWAVAAVYGAYVGIAETVQRALIPRFVKDELKRGTAYGLYNMVVGIAFLAANVVFGFLLDASGVAAAGAYSVATTAVAMCALAAFFLAAPGKK